MRTFDFHRYTFCTCVAVAMLAGCGGSQLPLAAPAGMPQRSEIAADDGGSAWMAPNAARRDLLYVSSRFGVSVYAYPQGKLVGKLRGFTTATGQCVDGKGDVYITDEGTGRIHEYAHGGTKRIKTLVDPGSIGCSIDPTTGNLAVTSFGVEGVAIFKNARGKATKYTDPSFEKYFFCGYDEKGNLFVDGLSHPSLGDVVFADLPKSGSKLKTIALDRHIGWPGGVQWDGKYLAVGDQSTPTIYRFSIVGGRGTNVGSVHLGSNANDIQQFFIQGHTVIAPNACVPGKCGANVLFFEYPAGGKATKKITRALKGFPAGASVSLAPAAI